MSKPPVTDNGNMQKHTGLQKEFTTLHFLPKEFFEFFFEIVENIRNKSVDIYNITEQKVPKKSESGPTENAAMKTVESNIEEKENRTNFEDSIAKILPKVSEGGATFQSGIKSLLPVYFLDCIFIGTYFIFF